jgi:energy-coupling factor transporter transmembrane protein EcfT
MLENYKNILSKMSIFKLRSRFLYVLKNEFQKIIKSIDSRGQEKKKVYFTFINVSENNIYKQAIE